MNTVRNHMAAWMMLCGLAAGAAAAPRQYIVHLADSAPKIDGDFGDACWGAVAWAQNLSPFVSSVQRRGPDWEDDEGDGMGWFVGAPQEPPAATQFAVVWREGYLYVAARVLEPAMAEARAQAPDGDKGILTEDHFRVLLASDKERDRVVQLAVNAAAGRLKIAQAEGKQTLLPAGEKWRAACRRTAGGWNVEIACPLDELGIDAKEGVVVAGNLARARLHGGELEQWSWTAPGNSLEDGRSFGRFVLAGPPAPEDAAGSLASALSTDMATTSRETRLYGRVVSLGEDGNLRFAGSAFRGDLVIRRPFLTRIDFGLRDAEPPATRLTLINGDSTRGRVKSIGEKETVFDSAAAGTLRIPNSSILSIDRVESDPVSVDTLFASTDVAPWRVWREVNGIDGIPPWILTRDVRAPTGPGSRSLGNVVASVRCPEGATVVADLVVPKGNAQWNLTLALARKGNAATGLARFQVFHGRFQLSGQDEQGVAAEGVIKANSETLRVRIACDNNARKLLCWVNGDLVGQGRVAGPLSDRIVVVSSIGPLLPARMRVLPGVAFPDKKMDVEGEAGPLLVALTNGESLDAESVAFSDGAYTIRTAQGMLRLDVATVLAVRFNPGIRTASPRQGAPFTVMTDEGSYRMSSLVITEKALIGESPILGRITLNRAALWSVEFGRTR